MKLIWGLFLVVLILAGMFAAWKNSRAQTFDEIADGRMLYDLIATIQSRVIHTLPNESTIVRHKTNVCIVYIENQRKQMDGAAWEVGYSVDYYLWDSPGDTLTYTDTEAFDELIGNPIPTRRTKRNPRTEGSDDQPQHILR